MKSKDLLELDEAARRLREALMVTSPPLARQKAMHAIADVYSVAGDVADGEGAWPWWYWDESRRWREKATVERDETEVPL